MRIHGLSEKTRTLVQVTIIVFGLTGVVFMSRWIDAHRPAPATAEDESLYLDGATAKRLSLGFNGLAADWYWMRSLQYVGNKILKAREDLVIDDLGELNVKLLAPMLDTATTLDPHFLEPYEYAAIVLGSVDVDEAIRITVKGIEANPEAWRLYHHLGYIYWQQQNYQAASETYAKGSRIAGAPAWMEAMSARMAAEGGSRGVAREIYGRMYEQATDERVRDMARRRLMQVDSFDQRDALRKILNAYKQQVKRCPASWKEIEPVLRTLKWRLSATGAPLDPSDTPYALDAERCEVLLDKQSVVPAS